MSDSALESLRSAVLHQIGVARRQQLHALDQMKECALIAAHQTTDVRLQLLERPPPPDPQSVLWEAAIGGCFGFAGSMIVEQLTNVFNDLLRTRLAFALLPKSPLGHGFREDLRRLRQTQVGAYEQMLADLYKGNFTPGEHVMLYDDIKSVLAKSRADFKLFKAGFLQEPEIRALYHESTFKMVDPVIAKAGDADTWKKLVKDAMTVAPSTDLAQGELPTAGMVRSALSFFNRQIEVQNTIMDDLSQSVSRVFDKADLVKLLMLLGPEETRSPVSVMLKQDMWIRFMEFCVWTRLYPDIGTDATKLRGLPETLVQYLLRRVHALPTARAGSAPLQTIAELAKRRTKGNNEFIRRIGKIPLSETGGWEQGEFEQANIILARQWRACKVSVDKAISDLFGGLS